MNSSSGNETTNTTGFNWIKRDEEVVSLLSPIVAYISVLMTSGVIGNSLVCYVCYRKWKERKIQYFIGFLATFDLLTCCICMPMEIVMLRQPLLIDNGILCKLQRGTRAVTSLAAGGILVIIAVDRYISICKHTRTRIQPSQALRLCLVSVLLALIFSWPAFILFGMRSLSPDEQVIAETQCSTLNDYAPYPLIYYGIIFVLFFGISTSLVLFYTLIWLRILRLPNLTSSAMSAAKRQSASESADLTASNFKNTLNFDPAHKSTEGSKDGTCMLSLKQTEDNGKPRRNTLDRRRHKSNVDESDSCDFSTDISRSNSIDCKSRKQNYTVTVNNNEKGDTEVMRPRTNTQEGRSKRFIRKSSFLGSISMSSNGSTRSNRNMVRRRRLTIAMFVITIVQILSFLPYIVLLICKNFIPDFPSSHNSTAQVAYNIGILSHFISSGVNPFVYGFCSKIFRREFKKVFCKKLQHYSICRMIHS
ncbi:muscarinic acetylcholine receptor M5-like isoform X2 [Mytilus californianus]|nr:muscarinic acetylcholine receptor M5-like isoform X2 [Mytilus californianus]XP_052097252.1 muscarinic acetylcholine receptor M5-like isoform X2 [Mytilus californianus]